MNPPFRVALLGFTPFEREHFSAGLAPERDGLPAYQLCPDLAAAALALVDADHESAVAEVRAAGRLSSALMIGGTPQPGAAAQLSRAFQLPQLLRAMDELVAAAPPMSAEVQRVREMLAQMIAASAPRPARPRPRLDPVLVVDSAEAVLRFMAGHLARFGFEVHLARDGAEALRRVADRHFEIVFIATALDGLDGFHVCRTLQRRPAEPRRPRPMVVLLLEDASPVQRLRAEQCGADAWLTKPLDAQALLAAMGPRELHGRREAETTHAGSTLL